MPYSQVVEQRYRVQPLDLGGPTLVVITNVTLQGLEQIHPVLHFDRLQKRLMLDDAQSDELARITQSAVFADWVGHEVLLTPVSEDNETRIALSSPSAPPSPLPVQPAEPTEPRRSHDVRLPTIDFRSVRHAAHLTWQTLLVLVLIILLIAAFYAVNNTELLWEYWGNFGFPQGVP